MGFLDFFRRKRSSDKTIIADNNADLLANAPIFKKMMEAHDLEKKEFDIILDLIHPIIKYGNESKKKFIVDGKEIELPYSSLPVIIDLKFDNLSLIFGIDKGTHYEWLQNKDIEKAREKGLDDNLLMKRAFENLLEKISLKGEIGISMIGDKIGMLTNCLGMESSFILNTTLWNDIRENLNTDEVLFGIPVQDVFIFCDKNSPEATKLLVENISNLTSNPNMQKKISKNVYLRTKQDKFEIVSS